MAQQDVRDPQLDYAAWLDAIDRDGRGLVAVERPGPTCALVRMDDPANHNALSGALTIQLQRALAELCADARLRSIVLTGTGEFTRRLGYARAMELVLRGGAISGREAAELGLVNAALPRDELLSHALAWGERIARLPEHVPAMSKPLLRAACDASFEQTLLAEEYAEPNTFTTRSHQETVRELLAKEERA
jgi:2-(1,2-epoxy-1,2-dihydrophenyl)acetyl-CoA isomerase